jgi:hypothetical protein
MERVFSGRVTGGKLHVRGWKALDWRDCEVTITVEKKHAIRSLDANRYYFGVCLALISEHTGYTVDELHDWAKQKFIPKHVAICDKNGEIKDDLVIGGTTTRLNRVQFYEYVEAIRKFAAEELSIDIPDPDPNWREKTETAA